MRKHYVWSETIQVGGKLLSAKRKMEHAQEKMFLKDSVMDLYLWNISSSFGSTEYFLQEHGEIHSCLFGFLQVKQPHFGLLSPAG